MTVKKYFSIGTMPVFHCNEWMFSPQSFLKYIYYVNEFTNTRFIAKTGFWGLEWSFLPLLFCLPCFPGMQIRESSPPEPIRTHQQSWCPCYRLHTESPPVLPPWSMTRQKGLILMFPGEPLLVLQPLMQIPLSLGSCLRTTLVEWIIDSLVVL